MLIALDIEADARGNVGGTASMGDRVERFHGWLDLLRALEDLLGTRTSVNGDPEEEPL